VKSKILAITCFLVGLLFITLHEFKFFIPGLVAKALIMPLIMAILIINPRSEKNTLQSLMFAGLFFSWTGDVLLEFSSREASMFIAGLVGFLLAHVMYLIVFIKTPGKNVIFSNRYYLLIPVIAYGTFFLFFINDYLGEMRGPVIIYAIIMLAMLTGALNRIDKVNRVSFVMTLAGAVLFVISDSLIAVGKFIHPFAISTVLIMTTYVAAQLFITIGYIRQSARELA